MGKRAMGESGLSATGVASYKSDRKRYCVIVVAAGGDCQSRAACALAAAMWYNGRLYADTMLDLVYIPVFALHLLAVNVAAAAPLVCIWLRRREARHGDAAAGAVGQLCPCCPGALLLNSPPARFAVPRQVFQPTLAQNLGADGCSTTFPRSGSP